MIAIAKELNGHHANVEAYINLLKPKAPPCHYPKIWIGALMDELELIIALAELGDWPNYGKALEGLSVTAAKAADSFYENGVDNAFVS